MSGLLSDQCTNHNLPCIQNRVIGCANGIIKKKNQNNKKKQMQTQSAL